MRAGVGRGLGSFRRGFDLCLVRLRFIFGCSIRKGGLEFSGDESGDGFLAARSQLLPYIVGLGELQHRAGDVTRLVGGFDEWSERKSRALLFREATGLNEH